MELHQLEQFRVTAELEHVTQAALRLHVAQPALSRTIRALEQELNMPLFERKNKRIKLNDSGRVLLDYTQRINTLIGEMNREIKEMNKHNQQTIRILLRSDLPFLMNVICGFSEQYPNSHFQIASYVENTMIYNDEFDFELGVNLMLDKTYNSIPIYQDRLFVAVPYSHPLSNVPDVPLQKWENNTFLLPPFDLMSKASEIRALSYLKGLQFCPKSILTCTDFRTMYSLIREGMGIGLTCRFQRNEIQSGISFIPIQGEQFPVTINFAWQKNRLLSPICESFMRYIINCGKLMDL